MASAPDAGVLVRACFVWFLVAAMICLPAPAKTQSVCDATTKVLSTTTYRTGYQSAVVVQSYQQTYYKWCWASVYKWRACTRMRTAYRQITMVTTIARQYIVTTCCSGYSRNTFSSPCIPVCSSVCQNGGMCSAPNTCKCTSGYTGSTCTTAICKSACVNGGVCSAPNTCRCNAGYKGDQCQDVCPSGTYGYGCKPCGCRNGGSCNKFSSTQKCSCLPGFVGSSCETKCQLGSCGTGCSATCNCGPSGACDYISCKCTCSPGFTGASCGLMCLGNTYGQGCAQPCPCQNGAACNPVTGQCTCTAGWTGAACNLPCATGMFGLNCAYSCSCGSHGTCNPINGSCTCAVGYIGTTCQPCTGFKYGVGCSQTCSCKTQNTDSCSNVDGTCTCTQKDGGQMVSCWQGDDCNVKCPDANGRCMCGPATVCTPSCKYGVCIKSNCVCNPGYSGIACDQPCAVGRYGINCIGTCSCLHGVCSSTTGVCACLDGYAGAACNETCPQGTYGAKCSLACSCQNGGTCDAKTGICTCSGVYSGPTCSDVCQRYPLHYQSAPGNCSMCDCQLNTTKKCGSLTGECKCASGYAGRRCDYGCPDGTYGDQCGHTCSCMNGATCDTVTGTCTCALGYVGTTCDTPCPLGMFGFACRSACTCKNGAACDIATGTCNCTAGWMGSACDMPCPVGFQGYLCAQPCDPALYKYGSNCALSCACSKPNTISCSTTTGACTCQPGWSGTECALACPMGTHGLGCAEHCPCQHGGKCNPIDGTCSCTNVPGYNGTFCEEECAHPHYGVLCASICSCGGFPCFTNNGTCICGDGFYGASCQFSCLPGFWGDSCRNICPCNGRGVCDTATGLDCNCDPGWRGTTCGRPCPPGSYGLNCTRACQCDAGDVCNAINGTCSSAHSPTAQSTVATGNTVTNDGQEAQDDSSESGYYGIIAVPVVLAAVFLLLILRRPQRQAREKNSYGGEGNGVKNDGGGDVDDNTDDLTRNPAYNETIVGGSRQLGRDTSMTRLLAKPGASDGGLLEPDYREMFGEDGKRESSMDWSSKEHVSIPDAKPGRVPNCTPVVTASDGRGGSVLPSAGQGKRGKAGTLNMGVRNRAFVPPPAGVNRSATMAMATGPGSRPMLSLPPLNPAVPNPYEISDSPTAPNQYENSDVPSAGYAVTGDQIQPNTTRGVLSRSMALKQSLDTYTTLDRRDSEQSMSSQGTADPYSSLQRVSTRHNQSHKRFDQYSTLDRNGTGSLDVDDDYSTLQRSAHPALAACRDGSSYDADDRMYSSLDRTSSSRNVHNTAASAAAATSDLYNTLDRVKGGGDRTSALPETIAEDNSLASTTPATSSRADADPSIKDTISRSNAGGIADGMVQRAPSKVSNGSHEAESRAGTAAAQVQYTAVFPDAGKSKLKKRVSGQRGSSGRVSAGDSDTPDALSFIQQQRKSLRRTPGNVQSSASSDIPESSI